MSRPTFAFMRGIIDAYKALPGNMGGGCLWPVLEEHLYSDANVAYCLGYARNNNDPDGVFLGKLLLQFTESERREIIELESRA